MDVKLGPCHNCGDEDWIDAQHAEGRVILGGEGTPVPASAPIAVGIKGVRAMCNYCGHWTVFLDVETRQALRTLGISLASFDGD